MKTLALLVALFVAVLGALFWDGHRAPRVLPFGCTVEQTTPSGECP